MGEPTFTPEGMPKLRLGGNEYPLWFSIYSVQRWAEYKGIDYQQALEAGWNAVKLPLDDLKTLLLIAFDGGEARKVAFAGGDPRTIGEETLAKVFAIYSPIELGVLLARAWNGLPEGDESSPNPEAPHA